MKESTEEIIVTSTSTAHPLLRLWYWRLQITWQTYILHSSSDLKQFKSASLCIDTIVFLSWSDNWEYRYSIFSIWLNRYILCVTISHIRKHRHNTGYYLYKQIFLLCVWLIYVSNIVHHISIIGGLWNILCNLLYMIENHYISCVTCCQLFIYVYHGIYSMYGKIVVILVLLL